MIVSQTQRNAWWNHFIERWAVGGQNPGHGVTGSRLRKIKKDTLIDFYCPACGKGSKVSWQWHDLLSPGGNEDTDVTCPNCGKRWRIEIAFMEIEP